uniref:Uncharacterized protein n=1 Tax=Daphnia galeata TaxID=27404 RepID=A0A8J2S1H3_9CRUS|nr:unnamed protein product [Daphnia galeata]
MKIYEFDECCCGCSLRTGTKVIGVFFMFVGIGLFFWFLLEGTFSINIYNEDEVMLTINNTHQIISLSVEIVATTLLLICALKNRKPTLLVPWLVLRGSVMPVLIGISLYLTALLTIKIGIKTGMAFMAVSLIATVIYFYFWLVVFNYYHELRNKYPYSGYAVEKRSLLDNDYADNKSVITI